MLEVLLEEPSAENALRILVPRLVSHAEEHVNFELRVFRGKDDLLRKLPDRLRGYASWARHADVRILVLVDRDDDECVVLKREIDRLAVEAGLTLHTRDAVPTGGSFKTRIACEEIEAWFLGDAEALRSAYPRVAKNFEHRAGFRDVDNIHGGTWEKLQRILQDAGYFSNGLRKIELARTLAPLMSTDHNRSVSFRYFCEAVRDLFPAGGVDE
ncbi:DUF4276 family protein [Streptomyces sp. MPA0124]|uniref:DUF4276 family protein n=1 Tax=Streptomyces sp. MPA0124 TaxID=3378069 RepID=UPI0022F0F6A4|nr:DUF4276 family protein [Streptomyces sp. MS2A]